MSFSIAISATVDDDADRVFARLEDVARYPELTPTVHEVVVDHVDGQQRSAWRVAFRAGILCWTELDVIDPVARTLTFEQIDGDVDRFDGVWRVTPGAAGTEVVFEAFVDLGIASLAAIVDPVARTTLRQVIHDILNGLFGDVVLHSELDVPQAVS